MFFTLKILCSSTEGYVFGALAKFHGIMILAFDVRDYTTGSYMFVLGKIYYIIIHVHYFLFMS